MKQIVNQIQNQRIETKNSYIYLYNINKCKIRF